MNSPAAVAAFRSWDEADEAQRVLRASSIEAQARPRDDSVERLCADVPECAFDVIVDARDAESAIALLRRRWPDEAEATAEVRCPACGSTDVFRLPRLRIFLAVAAVMVAAGLAFDQRDLFLLVAAIIGGVLLLTPRWRCRACGERWR